MMLERLLSLLGEPRCIGCNVAGRAGFCDRCLRDLQPGQTRGHITYAFQYTGPMQKAILRWKEGGRERHGPLLAALLAERAQALVTPPVDLVVPVPPAFWRTLARGFHPPNVLGRAVAERLGARFVPKALKRVDQARQMGRDRKARTRELLTSGRDVSQVEDKHVLIVDDVVTTGATARDAMFVVSALRPKTVRFLALAAVP